MKLDDLIVAKMCSSVHVHGLLNVNLVGLITI